MFIIFRENISESNCDRGHYTWIFMFALRSPLPRSETATVRTNPNPNPIPNSNLSQPIPSRGDSKENVYLHGSVNYRHAVNCGKLIKVKVHRKL